LEEEIVKINIIKEERESVELELTERHDKINEILDIKSKSN